jgi:hypothetical protein
MNNKISGHHLHRLIGARARYQNQLYEVLEILEDDPPALVLQNMHHTTIQPDQHGEAHRRVPETVTVPLALKGGDAIDFNEMELELLETDEARNTLVS